MPPAATPSVTATVNHPSAVAADLLLVPAFEGESLEDIAGARDATGRAVENAVASGEFRGKPYEVFLTAVTGWAAPRMLLVGAGTRATFNTERLRKIATTGALSAKARRVRRIAFVLRGDLPEAAAIQAVAEGLMLAAYNGDFYKSSERSGPPPQEMVIVAKSGEQPSLDAAAKRGTVLGESCNIARDLCNEPPNVLTPAVLAERAAKIAKDVGLTVDVLDEKGIAALNMGLLLGVGQGSAQPPRLVVIKHIPKGAPDAPVLGLIGKGITFDTGGI